MYFHNFEAPKQVTIILNLCFSSFFVRSRKIKCSLYEGFSNMKYMTFKNLPGILHRHKRGWNWIIGQTQVDLGTTIQSEVSQKEKNKYIVYMITYIIFILSKSIYNEKLLMLLKILQKCLYWLCNVITNCIHDSPNNSIMDI